MRDICMKKLLLSLLICFIGFNLSALADQYDINTDLWSDYNTDEIINNGKEATNVTDEEFEHLYNFVKNAKNQLYLIKL